MIELMKLALAALIVTLAVVWVYSLALACPRPYVCACLDVATPAHCMTWLDNHRAQP